MAISDLWTRRKPGRASTTEVSLRDFIDNYDIVTVDDTPGRQFAVVSERAPLGELGSTDPTPWVSFNRREYNPDLVGLKGLEKYDRMRKSDGTVRGTMRLFKTPILSASWFMEPGGDKLKDKKAAEFVWKNLTELMSISWTQVLTEALLSFDFGYYMFEKVYDERDVPGYGRRTIWKKLAPRHPMDVETWVVDENGGPVGAWFHSTAEDAAAWRDEYMAGMNAKQTVNMPGQVNKPPQNVGGLPNLDFASHPYSIFIPIEKLVVFTYDKESGNIEGTSVLRSAYKHWFYKEQLYKIDAIQKERHGIGIPVIKLPMGYKDEDKRAAEELGRNIRTNERAHIVLPPGWEIMMLKLEGTPMDCIKSIQHHDELIEKNIVAYFLRVSGNNVNQDVLVDLFLKSARYTADIVAETFNMYCIPQLVDYNFPGAAYPKLKHRHISEAVDWRTMSFAIRNFIGAGVIQPDERLEESIREQLGLPKIDEETTRVVVSPQAGPNGGGGVKGTPTAPGLPRTGQPRQAPVGRQRNTQGLPKGDAGRDGSGGSR